MANEKGEIFDLPGYAAAGMAGEDVYLLAKGETVDMPYASELMMLPDRSPVMYDIETETFETLAANPYDETEDIFPVAVFNSPGYVNRYFCAHVNERGAHPLPLFSYGAAGFGGENFRSAAVLVDSEPRQDLRQMPRADIDSGIRRMQDKYPSNRLMRHLENCALVYGCPAGKNFFLKRYEAPLPTARTCNADCIGCISLQKEGGVQSPQNRISFTPSAEEIAETALEHIKNVENPVVSFGQGCEGDPLTAFHLIEPAVRMIRQETGEGTINMNTNAGLPDKLEHLLDAGLDSVRVSLNSTRKPTYNAYFRPKGYSFEDVLKSIEIAGKMKKFVSLNLLNCPGFTDSMLEFDALKRFLATYPVRMIQWRNMNFDPVYYTELMFKAGRKSPSVGIANMIKDIEKLFPHLMHGYFNPPKERYGIVC
ncbi:MAG: radical SAM protein [Desulfarculaceae bacterium]|nr:radical SAM protein [Desulfarculaceae bacterium]